MWVKIRTYWNLFRIPNLIIIGLGICLYQYCVITPILSLHNLTPFLTPVRLVFVILSILCIVAGSFCINDYFDVTTDGINKKDKQIVGNTVSKKQASRLYYIITTVGIILSVYPSWELESFIIFLCFPVVAIVLWHYSYKYKRIPLLGNILVSFLAAFSVIFISLFEILHLQSTGQSQIIRQLLLLASSSAGFAFFFNFIRELIKTMESAHGDSRARYNTLAVKIGVKKTKYFTLLIIALLIVSLCIAAFYCYKRNIQSLFYYIIFAMILPLFFLFYKTYTIRNSKNCHWASNLSKIITILALLSLLVVRMVLLDGIVLP
jgi:4-hydroxybenzoate polyprenyltransferase